MDLDYHATLSPFRRSIAHKHDIGKADPAMTELWLAPMSLQIASDVDSGSRAG
jgi:hypothetical protein